MKLWTYYDVAPTEGEFGKEEKGFIKQRIAHNTVAAMHS